MTAKGFFSLALCFALAGQLSDAGAAQAAPWRNWNNLLTLQPGRNIRVETRRPKKKLKGTFISSDEAGITVRLRDGGSQKIARDAVRKVTAGREAMKYAGRTNQADLRSSETLTRRP